MIVHVDSRIASGNILGFVNSSVKVKLKLVLEAL